MKKEMPSRRAVLRGAMAVGCGLFLPGLLAGCDSKKDVTATGSAPAATPPASSNAAAPVAQADSASGGVATKASQESVQYRTQPNGDQKCDGCQHFIAGSNTCQLVEGQISPDGWCVLWAKKT